MATELSLPKGFGAVSSVFAGHNSVNDELGAGITSSYAVMGFRGKVWATKFQGKETPLMRDDGDGARGSIEVVIVKAATPISKIYYKGGYQDGANAAPDCWSANGIIPDASVQNKCNKTCADCPMNAWGSRTTEAGKAGKACSDSRRIAIVPMNDLSNETLGGPMLLRVPAATLKDLKAYGDLMSSYGYPYFGVATRVSFDPKEAYPKLVFSAIRPLTDEEGGQVIALREDKRTASVLNEVADMKAVSAPAEEAAAIPDSPFEMAAPVAAPKAAAPKPAPKAPKPAPVAAAPAPVVEEAETVDEETGEVTTASGVPDSFDALLDDIL